MAWLVFWFMYPRIYISCVLAFLALLGLRVVDIYIDRYGDR